MTNTQNHLIASNLADVHIMKRLSLHLLSDFEKLAELNMAISKTFLSDSFRHAMHMLDAKDPQQWMSLQMKLIEPMSEKSARYGGHIVSLSTDASTELAKAMEAKLGDLQKEATKAISNLMPNAASNTVNSESTTLAIK